MHNKHREKYLYVSTWIAHLKEHGVPPAKKEKSPSPFSVFPGTDPTAPEPPEPPSTPDDTYVQPGPHHLWGQPGVPQATSIKLLKPQGPGLGRVILPKQLSHVPVVVRPWSRPPINVPVQPPRAPMDLQTESVVENCLRRLENFFMPMHSALNRMMVVNDALYRHNLQMAYKMGQHGLGLPEEETPVDVPQDQVDEAHVCQQDPYANDTYTHPEASGSGGTGQIPVVVIDPRGTTERRVRLRFKQTPKKRRMARMALPLKRVTRVTRVTSEKEEHRSCAKKQNI